MKKWNEGQIAILDSISRDHNILVSAAAGSGKTSVMVERIVNGVEQGLCGIDEILVVTFTKAAAAQMKGKITKELEERAYNSGDARMLRQLSLAANADISTIDSFCNRVVRENFQEAGVDPGFDILDRGENTLMEEDVMDSVLERLYRDPEFAGFAQAFFRNTRKDDMLRDLIKKLHKVSQGFADPEDWLGKCCPDPENLLASALSGPWAVALLKEMKQIAKTMEDLLVTEISVYEKEADPDRQKIADKVVTALKKDLLVVDGVLNAGTLLEAAVACKGSIGRFPNKEYEMVYPEMGNELPDRRTKLLSALRDNTKNLSEESLEQELQNLIITEEHLLRAVRLFHDELLREKKRRKKYDYSDIAHFAYRVLRDPETGKVTPVGQRYADKYRYIYIDEYQDGSDMQEHILNSVARTRDGKPCNIFMVGDVKQSIYRFRQARPQLFLEKEAAYKKDGTNGEVLYLNRNYRSRNEILRACNEVFRRLMSPDFGGIDYDENVQLNPPEGREDQWDPYFLPEVLLSDPKSGDEDMDEVESDVLEARLIGRKILELVEEKQEYSFGDIVILQRSVKGCGRMLKEYARLGIPVRLEDPSAYFDAEEVVVILSLLQIIDNSRQDIPYAAVLRSPIGDCGDAELACLAMQRSDTSQSLYDVAGMLMEDEAAVPEALEEMTEGLKVKLQRLNERLLRWKRDSRYLSIDRLVERILEETGYRQEVARMSEGDRRLANLLQLQYKAEEFEKAGNHGLFTFLRYIDQCKVHQVDFAEDGSISEGNDAVRICTMHSSKGLEFPVVFVARLGKSFNVQDTKNKITVSADYGMAPKITRKAAGKYWLSKGGFVNSIVNYLYKQDARFEELRLLYVAMTRAEDRLYMTGVVKGLEEAIEKKTTLYYTDKSKAANFLDFLLPILSQEGIGQYIRTHIYDVLSLEEVSPAGAGKADAAEQEMIPDEAAEAEAAILREKYAYTYPYQAAVYTRTKLSVSEVKHEAMERKGISLTPTPEKPAEAEAETKTEAKAKTDAEPKAESKEESRNREEGGAKKKAASGITGADYGTAVHKLMELLPFEQIGSKKEMRETLKELLAGPFFTEDLRKALRVDKIEQFYSDAPDSLFQRMKRAKQRGDLHVEQQFLIGLPARRLGQEIPLQEEDGEQADGGRFATEEPVVLQGIIDGFFLEKDEEGKPYAVLMDYKTDRVDSPEQLIDRYYAQMSLYRETIEDILQLPVREMWLYGFSAGLGEIRIPDTEKTE